MAVYTALTEPEMVELLREWDMTLQSFTGIKDGTENTNYFVETDKGKFVLTLCEARTSAQDLPMVLQLLQHCAKQNIPCPLPQVQKNGETTILVKNKPACLVSFFGRRL